MRSIKYKLYSTVSTVLYSCTEAEVVVHCNFPIKKPMKNTNLKHMKSANQLLSTANQN